MPSNKPILCTRPGCDGVMAVSNTLDGVFLSCTNYECSMMYGLNDGDQDIEYAPSLFGTPEELIAAYKGEK